MGQKIDMSTTVVASSDHLVAGVGTESVVLGMWNGTYYGLDEVGARTWELMRAPVTVSTVREAILREFKVDAGKCERDLLAFLESLEIEGMIEVTHQQAE